MGGPPCGTPGYEYPPETGAAGGNTCALAILPALVSRLQKKTPQQTHINAMMTTATITGTMFNDDDDDDDDSTVTLVVCPPSQLVLHEALLRDLEPTKYRERSQDVPLQWMSQREAVSDALQYPRPNAQTDSHAAEIDCA